MPDQFGYVRVACVSPVLYPAEPQKNAPVITEVARELANKGAEVILFPELSITGYTCEDLFYSKVLLEESLRSLELIIKKTADVKAIIGVGLPLLWSGRIWNVCAIIGSGKVHALIPKRYLPTAQEFYDSRWFASGELLEGKKLNIRLTNINYDVPFNPNIILYNVAKPELQIAIEICEDAWVPEPPSLKLASTGSATLILNPSASNAILGKAEYRRNLVKMLSAMTISGYAYASAGGSESTSETVFSGHLLICENGQILAEKYSIDLLTHYIIADVDIDSIILERSWHTSYRQVKLDTSNFHYVPVNLPIRHRPLLEPPLRNINPYPFIPKDPQRKYEHCKEIIQIQSTALSKRLTATGINKMIVGVSGGVDSTHALLVCVHTAKKLKLDLKDAVHAVIMPGPGSTTKTQNNAMRLARALGVSVHTIPIKEVTTILSNQLGIKDRQSTAFENIQARLRTLILMAISNKLNGLMIGTSDLSELALGWCTYAGDQISMYHINAGVPKTLIKHLIEWFATNIFKEPVSSILKDILRTPITPELIPSQDDKIIQKTEEILGPFDIHDFFLYHFIRHHMPPEKIFYLAIHAFKDTYKPNQIIGWMEIFFKRFFKNQFKRTATPCSPKVGTVALSPRADWRMPADVSPSLWLKGIRVLGKTIASQNYPLK